MPRIFKRDMFLSTRVDKPTMNKVKKKARKEGVTPCMYVYKLVKEDVNNKTV